MGPEAEDLRQQLTDECASERQALAEQQEPGRTSRAPDSRPVVAQSEGKVPPSSRKAVFGTLVGVTPPLPRPSITLGLPRASVSLPVI